MKIIADTGSSCRREGSLLKALTANNRAITALDRRFFVQFITKDVWYDILTDINPVSCLEEVFGNETDNMNISGDIYRGFHDDECEIFSALDEDNHQHTGAADGQINILPISTIKVHINIHQSLSEMNIPYLPLHNSKGPMTWAEEVFLLKIEWRMYV